MKRFSTIATVLLLLALFAGVGFAGDKKPSTTAVPAEIRQVGVIPVSIKLPDYPGLTVPKGSDPAVVVGLSTAPTTDESLYVYAQIVPRPTGGVAGSNPLRHFLSKMGKVKKGAMQTTKANLGVTIRRQDVGSYLVISAMGFKDTVYNPIVVSKSWEIVD